MSPKHHGPRRFVRPTDEVRRLTTLVELGQAAGAMAEEDQILATALTTVAGMLPGHAIALAIEQEGDVRIPDRLLRGRMPIETATLVAALALDRREPVEREEAECALVAFPLAGSRGPIGALVASLYRAEITDADHAMLHATAQQLALTLENLRLRRQVDHLMFRFAQR